MKKSREDIRQLLLRIANHDGSVDDMEYFEDKSDVILQALIADEIKDSNDD